MSLAESWVGSDDFLRTDYWDGGLPVSGKHGEIGQPRPFDIKIGQKVFEEFARFPTFRSSGETLPKGYNFYVENYAPGTILRFDHEALIRGVSKSFNDESQTVLKGKHPLYSYRQFESIPAEAEQKPSVYLRRQSFGVVLPAPYGPKLGLFSYAYDDPETFKGPDIFKVGFCHNPLVVGETVYSQELKQERLKEISERLISMEVFESVATLWDYHAEQTLKTFRGRLLNLMA